MKKELNKNICRHALASHEGHGMVYLDEATKDALTENCCGGVMTFRFCPFCGENIHEWVKAISHPSQREDPKEEKK